MPYEFSNVIVVSVLHSGGAGNRASSPRRYWPWVNAFPEYDIMRVQPKEVERRVVIFGGGMMISEKHREQLEMIASRAKEWYLWGVGIEDVSMLDWEIVQQAQLVGLRDSIQNRDVLADIWDTACPSVMHPFFSNPPKPKHDIVSYVRSESLTPQLKTISTSAPIDDALYHISLGKCVVTDCYYGALWASWMGRQVMKLDDFSGELGELELELGQAGREAYKGLVRKQREFERFIGHKISIEPVG